MSTCDLIAVDGGSGGIAAGLRAARYGAKCALIEGASLGYLRQPRVCPKENHWHAALSRRTVNDAARFSIMAPLEKLNWQELGNTRTAYIAPFEGSCQRTQCRRVPYHSLPRHLRHFYEKTAQLIGNGGIESLAAKGRPN